MDNTAGRENRTNPDTARVRRFAEDAKEDLEDFNRMAARFTGLDEKFRKMDRQFTYPAAVLFPTILFIALLAYLYWPQPFSGSRIKNPVAVVGCLLWSFLVIETGAVFPDVKELRVLAWLRRHRKWIYLGLLSLALLLLAMTPLYP
ncbi:MAG TPA: hypothetical protein VLR94_04070 [Acidobacteriota bacterium]|nr:hypothetical protein [Acidobacteriota bacterium]